MRDAISIDLPVNCRGAVGRQELRLRLRSIVPIDDAVLCVADRRNDYVQSCCGDRWCQRCALHWSAPFPSPTVGIAECTENDGAGAKTR